MYVHMFSHFVLQRFPCAHFTIEEIGSEKGKNWHQIALLGNRRGRTWTPLSKATRFLQCLTTYCIEKSITAVHYKEGLLQVFWEYLVNFH